MLEKKGTEVGTAMVTWDAGVRALNHGTKDELVSGGSELTSFTIEIILLTFIWRSAITIIIIIFFTTLRFAEMVMLTSVIFMSPLLSC